MTNNKYIDIPHLNKLIQRYHVISIILFCILLTVDIWIERNLYHYTLELLNVYGLVIIGLVNWLLDLWEVRNGGYYQLSAL